MSSILTVTMPKWGLSMQEGKVNLWLKNVGDKIVPGEEIVEVESEKISGAVESAVSGVLRRQVAQPDEVLPVGALLGVIADADVPEELIDDLVTRFQAEFVPPSDDEADAGPQTQTVQVGGKQLRYLKRGEGGDALLLIHGFGGDFNNWLFSAGPSFAPGFRRLSAAATPPRTSVGSPSFPSLKSSAFGATSSSRQ